MDESRRLSRTAEGRAEILKRGDWIYVQLLQVLKENGDSSTASIDDGIATLANLLSEDGSKGAVLSKCLEHEIIFLSMIDRIKRGQNFVCCCVCLSNCWKQSARHRDELKRLGAHSALLLSINSEQYGLQALGALRGMLEAVLDNERTPTFTTEEALLLCDTICRASIPSSRRVSASRLLTCSDAFIISCQDASTQTSFVRACLVGSKLSLDDADALHEALNFMLGNARQHKWFELGLLPEGDFFGFLKAVLTNRKTKTDDTVADLASELCAFATQSEAVSSIPTVYNYVFAEDLDQVWLDVSLSASEKIPFALSERILDQSKVLPHAKTRLNVLTSLLHTSTSEPRARRLLSKHAHSIVSDIAIKYMEYDLEAVRCCMNILRNLTLADSRTVVLESNVTDLACRLLRSPDHHTAFIAAGIFRLACTRSGRTDPDSWARLVVNGQDLLTMLSIDLVKTHPHTRVELARALVALMEGLRNFEGSVPALETVQAVKFVSFLLEAPQPELHLEALNGLAGLSDGFLQALPSFDIEIIPGTGFVQRLKDIYALSKDDLEVKRLTVATACQALLRRMGIDVV